MANINTEECMTNKPLVYLASVYGYPYDDTITPQIREKRFKLVSKVAGKIIQKSEVDVYSPVAHSHPIAKYGKIPTHTEYWANYCNRMLGFCDELWILDVENWDKSHGIKEEIAYAKVTDKPIKMVTIRGRVYDYEKTKKEL